MKKIPLIKPDIPSIDTLYNDLQEMYRNSIYSNGGPFEQKFEVKTEKYFGKGNKTIAVSNATIGLIIALKALTNGNGYVLLPSFTFAATIEAIMYAGLTPVFVDVNKKNWSMILDHNVEKFVKKNHVKAILYCNPFGIEGNISEWEKFAKKVKLPLICDSAAGFGSFYSDKSKIGTKGDVEVLSLHATKTFSIGEGGLIVTKNKNLVKKIKSLRNFGFNQKKVVTQLGMNAKMGEIYSIIGLHVLNDFDKTIKQKKNLLEYYFNGLKDVVIFHPSTYNSALQFLPVLFPKIKHRKLAERSLLKHGISCRRYYYPALHNHPLFKDVDKIQELKGTEYLEKRMLALPIFNDLSKKEVDFICKIIIESIG